MCEWLLKWSRMDNVTLCYKYMNWNVESNGIVVAPKSSMFLDIWLICLKLKELSVNTVVNIFIW